MAASYTGVASTAGNIKLYWTLLDPSRTTANQLPITSTATTISGMTPTTTTTGAFLIGNENRNKNANFIGFVDEVRLSNIERTAVQMMFTSTSLSVVTQPQSQFVAFGDTVTLSAVIGGESPRYQWQHSSTNLPTPLLITHRSFRPLIFTFEVQLRLHVARRARPVRAKRSGRTQGSRESR